MLTITLATHPILRTTAALLLIMAAFNVMAATVKVEHHVPITVPAPASLPSYRDPSGNIRMPACYFAHILAMQDKTTRQQVTTLSNDCLVATASRVGYARWVGNFDWAVKQCAAIIRPLRPAWSRAGIIKRCRAYMTAAAHNGTMPFTR